MAQQLSDQQLIATFTSLTNWQDRYRKLIELSKILPAFPDEDKTTENQIMGCENHVWLTFSYNDSDKTFCFYGESEGRIIKGILAIIIVLIDGKTAEQIRDTDLLDTLNNFNIINNLGKSKQLGISHIIKRVEMILLSFSPHNKL